MPMRPGRGHGNFHPVAVVPRESLQGNGCECCEKPVSSQAIFSTEFDMTGHLPRTLRHFLPCVVLMACSLPASAQWTGKAEAGLAIASGNADSKTANAKVAIARKDGAWEHSGSLAGLYVRSAGDTTARRWELGAQTRYSFGTHTFWFGAARYEKDRFSGFDHQGVVNTGIGRHFVASDTTKLTGQVGVGYKFSESLPTLTEPRDREKSIAGVAGLEFEHKVAETTTLFDRASAEITSDNNFLQNEAGVRVRMSDRLALSLAYEVRHNTRPPSGFRKTDTLTTVNLAYEVK